MSEKLQFQVSDDEMNSQPEPITKPVNTITVTSTTQPIITSTVTSTTNTMTPDAITVDVGPQQIIDDPMEEEEMRSEAVFQFRVENISMLKDSALSPPCYIRNLPWKIMVMQRTQADTRSLGFFVQCNGESDSSTWSCNAIAELRLLPQRDGIEPFVRKIKHLFYSKENDWGFSNFMAWNDVLDPERGFIANDAINLEVFVNAEAPHGVFWDSKKHTGYVGLKNQGATCYMNSLLQTLYFTNQLRKAVYKMPTEADDSSKSVALALQRVFHDLQFCDKPVGTKKLTKSFGWETLDSFMQHDVQEFLRVLLDKLESKMKHTCIEGSVPKLFEGKMSSYIKCKNVDYTSTRLETFYDIQLNIKGKKNIAESFKDYIASEILDGDNKYDAGDHGLQEAEKGVIFVSFPPVLHLHLMRFQYDPVTDNSVKFNDRFEFDEHIRLDDYLQHKEAEPANYTLHAVLVHSGDNHGGHYVVYINPLGDGKWCKFDDDVVAKCQKYEAIEQNYGGVDDDISLNAKLTSNAYMLVYIRDSAMSTVLEEINESDIPSELTERLVEERRMEQVRRRERSDSNSFMAVNVVLEEFFESHCAPELFDPEKVNYRVFKLKKNQVIDELMTTLADAFKIPLGRFRIWPLTIRPNQITRPVYFDVAANPGKMISQCAEQQNPWLIYLELLPPSSNLPEMPPFDREREFLIFFKNYDPVNKWINYMGHEYFKLSQKTSDLVAECNSRMGWPLDTAINMYVEQGATTVHPITNYNDTIEKGLQVLRDVMDGDILVFERKMVRDEINGLDIPTCEEYYHELLYRVDVLFIDKTNPNDPGFSLELSQRMNYGHMAQAVGQKLNVNPYEIQFFKCQNYKDIPGNALRCTFDGSLKDLLVYIKPKSAKKVFYQLLSMNINELESKKQFKCWMLSWDMKSEKELILYPNKNGTVKTLLEEAEKQVEFSNEGSGQLRIVEISGHKLFPGPREDTPLDCIPSTESNITANQKYYRIEQVPNDEVSMGDDEMLVPVMHFFKDVFNVFGFPFYIRVKQNEPFTNLKNRMQKRLGVSDKEFEKYKFALISMGRAEYIEEDAIINLAVFQNQPGMQRNHPSIGLEHVNKTPKRRFNYMEKAIKIYN